MINAEDILVLHYRSIEDFGGTHGLRDMNLLLPAINRPYQTFDNKELYETSYEKAAALCESLIINHPFVDGNKRIGLLAMLALLKEYHITVKAENEELFRLIIDISTGRVNNVQIAEWLREKTTD